MERNEIESLVQVVLAAAHRVSKGLGIGFLEKVYENAIALELAKSGLAVRQQAPISVLYGGQVIGEYVADLVVDDELIVELKAAAAIAMEHRLQVLNYLRASDRRLGLVLNFGRPRLEIARVVNRL